MPRLSLYLKKKVIYNVWSPHEFNQNKPRCPINRTKKTISRKPKYIIGALSNLVGGGRIGKTAEKNYFGSLENDKILN